MEKETEEMAFPGNVEYKTTFIGEFSGKEIATNAWKYQSGMTLRDYFAGQIIAGLIANGGEYTDPEIGARLAYSHADAMIKERDK